MTFHSGFSSVLRSEDPLIILIDHQRCQPGLMSAKSCSHRLRRRPLALPISAAPQSAGTSGKDVADPGRIVGGFVVDRWIERQRGHAPVTNADVLDQEVLNAFNIGDQLPIVRHLRPL